LNSIDAARKTVDELALNLKEENNKRDMKMLYWLEGLVELKSGDQKRAVEALEKAESLLLGNYGRPYDWDILDNVYYYDALAQAYFRSGKWGPAKARYERISSTGLFRWWPEIWVKSFYWQGRIAEERGKKAEARMRYEEFLELWKDSDPGITEVEDAKKRLAEL
jgi:tetratricopeptide (TPR) repeat protein